MLIKKGVFTIIIMGSLLPFKAEAQNRDQTKPNIVIIFTDDQGYGVFKLVRSSQYPPHLDKMAPEGQKCSGLSFP